MGAAGPGAVARAQREAWEGLGAHLALLRLLEIEVDLLQARGLVIFGPLAREERDVAVDVLALAGERGASALASDAVGRDEVGAEPDDTRVLGVDLEHLRHARAIGAVAALCPLLHLVRVQVRVGG